MNEPKKIGLFITRVQPGLHLGHIDGLKQAMEQGVTHFLIGIGSSDKEYTKENPFTCDERRKMVELSMKHLTGITYQIFSVPDFPSDEEWKKYIFEKLPKFDCVVTGNSWVKEIFEKEVEIIWLEMREEVNATLLRQKLAKGQWDALKAYLPEDVVSYLKKIKADERCNKCQAE